jgi:hypothetical protein
MVNTKRPGGCLAVGVLAALGATAVARGQEHESAAAPLTLRQTAYLKAFNPDAYDHFGCGGSQTQHTGNSIALSADGRTLAVGAPFESSQGIGIDGDETDNSAYGAGAVYVYHFDGARWVREAYVKASNTGRGDHFGSSVVLSADGNTMAVAAHYESSAAIGIDGDSADDSLPQAGAVYVFTRREGRWSEEAYLKASNTGKADSGDQLSEGDQFGFSLAISGHGDTLAVGAISEDSAARGIDGDQADDGRDNSGAVYVFRREAGRWSQQAYLKASNADAGDLFGFAVGLDADGDTLVASSYDEDGSARVTNGPDDNAARAAGALFVFEREGTSWRESAYLKGSRLEETDQLGYAVAISADGNTIAAGAGDEDCVIPGVNAPGCDADSPGDLGANVWIGAAYVYVRRADDWVEQAFFKASNPRPYASYGVRLALSGDGDTLAVSAYLEDEQGQGVHAPVPSPFLTEPALTAWRDDETHAEEAGAVYFYTRSGAQWTDRAYIKGSNTEMGDEFGSALALSGDGSLLVVGAHGEDGGGGGTDGDPLDNSGRDTGAVYVLSR